MLLAHLRAGQGRATRALLPPGPRRRARPTGRRVTRVTRGDAVAPQGRHHDYGYCQRETAHGDDGDDNDVLIVWGRYKIRCCAWRGRRPPRHGAIRASRDEAAGRLLPHPSSALCRHHRHHSPFAATVSQNQGDAPEGNGVTPASPRVTLGTRRPANGAAGPVALGRPVGGARGRVCRDRRCPGVVAREQPLEGWRRRANRRARRRRVGDDA